jgi:uncharacterized protein involved in exopolysaccharide biosynthesis/Mrp family chromosome partitioning ATPase
MLFRKEPKSATAPAAAVRPASADGEPDMRGLGRALWRRKVMILGLTLLSAGAAFLTVNTIRPRYQSEARLLLEARENVFLRAEADKTSERTTIDPEAVTSQIQLVLSRDLALEVIQKEKLADKPEFDPAAGHFLGLRAILGVLGIGRDLSAMSREERALEAYYDRISVYTVEKSRVIAINFSSEDSDLAAQVANTIAETYLNRQQAAKQEQTRAASLWLAGEIEKMRTRVAEAEAKVEDYRLRANLYPGSNNTSLPSQQLTEINSQIAAARGQKADLETRARQLRDQMGAGKPVDSADIAGSDTMRRLIEQRIAVRAQLAEQSTTLLDQHPRIKELKAQIGDIDRQIQIEGERLLRQLDNDAKVAGDRLSALMVNLEQAKKIASETSEQDVHLRALEREAKTQRDLLESYLGKYQEAAARDSISAAPPEARIISRASPAIKPSYPKKLAIVLIAAFAAFTLSAGFVITNALLAAPAPAYSFAYGPTFDAPRAMPSAQIVSPPLAPASPQQDGASGYVARTIDHVVRDMHSASDSGRVAVIGIVRNVGTTYAALTLARALAQNANVVLVDLALSAPNLSVVSTDPGAPGIAELTRGKASFGDIITRDQYSRVHLVAAGDVGSDVVTLSSSPMLATVIEALGRSYEYVVIDAGSAGDVSPDRLAPLATRAMLVAADPASSVTKAVRERLLRAGFREVAVIAGGAEAVAA